MGHKLTEVILFQRIPTDICDRNGKCTILCPFGGGVYKN